MPLEIIGMKLPHTAAYDPSSPSLPLPPPSSPSQELYESELQRSERLSGQLQRAKEEAIESKTKLRYACVSIECVEVGRVTTYQLNCNARMSMAMVSLVLTLSFVVGMSCTVVLSWPCSRSQSSTAGFVA